MTSKFSFGPKLVNSISAAASSSNLARFALASALSVLSILAGQHVVAKDSDPIRPVEGLEIERYLGKWYDNRSIPNSFQRGCANTTAVYGLEEGGTLSVSNKCDVYDEAGDFVKAQGADGRAWVKNADSSILKVSFACFFGFCLESAAGDYWVLGLGPLNADGLYSWAVVGTPNREYGWVLTRTPGIDSATMADVEAVIRDQGYNPADFVMTRHAAP